MSLDDGIDQWQTILDLDKELTALRAEKKMWDSISSRDIDNFHKELKLLRAVAEAAEKRLDVWTRETYGDLIEALKAWREMRK